jgi:alpha-aminoadipate carrier protein LysW
MAVCPECEANVEIDEFDVDKGEIISCPECGVELEVVGLSPLLLDLAPHDEDEDEWQE